MDQKAQSQLLKDSEQVRITQSSPFSQPALGFIAETGEPVRITHLGDAAGMSPVYNVVDSSGKSGWVSQSKVRIIDPNFLPTSPDAIEGLLQATESYGQSSRVGAGSGR